MRSGPTLQKGRVCRLTKSLNIKEQRGRIRQILDWYLVLWPETKGATYIDIAFTKSAFQGIVYNKNPHPIYFNKRNSQSIKPFFQTYCMLKIAYTVS